MELNKIIRRSGIAASTCYSKFTADLTEALKDIDGIVKEEIAAKKDADETVKENANTRFYLDSTKTRYIKIENPKNGIRVRFTCGNNTIDIDNGEYSSPYISYSIAKTPYGVMFTTLSYFSNATNNAGDNTFQNYVTVFTDENEREINGFIHVLRDSNITDVNESRDWIYLSTEKHNVFEMQRGYFQTMGSNANQTVLFNAVSYTEQIVAKHLYKKIQSETGQFGKINLASRTFISGSHYCLECKT